MSQSWEARIFYLLTLRIGPGTAATDFYPDPPKGDIALCSGSAAEPQNRDMTGSARPVFASATTIDHDTHVIHALDISHCREAYC